MALKQITIDTILGGWSPSEYFSTKGQFLSSIGIDPEMPKDDSSTRPSGLIRPTAMAKFSGTEITGSPLWMTTTNKNTNTYVYTSDGKIHVVDSNIAMATPLNGGAAITTSSGNGMEYYNNYIYYARNTDIGRYGPLSGTAALDDDWWTSSPMSKGALVNTSYPSINGVTIPNHAMVRHNANNRLYVCDVTGDNVGCIHMINTVKGTAEGDTNSTVIPSSYKVLDLYYGWWPTCISSYGSNLAIGVVDGINTTVKQRNAQVIIWSTQPSDTSYNIAAELPDPLITAMRQVNCALYVFSGSASGGMRISRYSGGHSFEEIAYLDDCYPPLQGAVDTILNRIIWGSATTTPATSASVFSLGSKSRATSMGVHNIIKSTAGATTPSVTSLRYVQLGARSEPIVGWKDNTGTLGALVAGMDKLSTTYINGANIWRSEIFRMGQPSIIKKIRIPLASAISTNNSFTVKIYKDDGSANVKLSDGNTSYTASNTNNSGKRFVDVYAGGESVNNFFIEITNNGTALTTISLPITILVETLEDNE
jgi:hypothetical protein